MKRKRTPQDLDKYFKEANAFSVTKEETLRCLYTFILKIAKRKPEEPRKPPMHL